MTKLSAIWGAIDACRASNSLFSLAAVAPPEGDLDPQALVLHWWECQHGKRLRRVYDMLDDYRKPDCDDSRWTLYDEECHA
jgi:hypothetical protein